MSAVRKVLLYTTQYCPFCVMAKRLLARKGVSYEEIAVDSDPGLRQEIIRKTGRRTVPVIFIGERHIGGFEEMAALDRKGELDPLLADPDRSS